MSGGGDFRRRHLARPNRPNWLVCHQDTGEFLGGQRAEAASELALQDFLVWPPLVRASVSPTQTMGVRPAAERIRFLGHVFVGLAEKLAALGVADDDVSAAASTSIAAEISPVKAPSLLPEDVLAGDGDVGGLAASTAAEIAVKGGAMTMSQWVEWATRGVKAEKKARVSAASCTSSSCRR